MNNPVEDTAMKKTIALLSVLSSAAAVLASGACRREPAATWYKGNLHAHTSVSDGDSAPDGVIARYKRDGYHFLAVTDHNHLTVPLEYARWEGDRFILIAGNEISDRFEKLPVHLLALGTRDADLRPQGGDSVADVLARNVRAIRAAGGVPVICHPNFGWAFGADAMIPIEGCGLFEVLNAHPEVNNAGREGTPGTEEIWELLLAAGKRFYGLGTDDTHALATYAGKSWIMLRAPALTEAAILEALERGDFYVSTGVTLADVRFERKRLTLRIAAEPGRTYRTAFIGPGGQVLSEADSPSPSFKLPDGIDRVRARVIDTDGRLALTQPFFAD